MVWNETLTLIILEIYDVYEEEKSISRYSFLHPHVAVDHISYLTSVTDFAKAQFVFVAILYDFITFTLHI